MVDYPALSGIDDASQVRLALVVNKAIAHVPLDALMDVLGFQPLDADLTAIAALATTTFGRALLTMADAAATQTALGLGSAATKELTPWVTYTPTITGFGTTPTNVSIWSRRVGDTLHMRGKFTCATPTAVEARLTLGFNGTNANVTSDATKVPSIQLAGLLTTNLNSASSWTVLIESNIGYLTFGLQNATNNGLTKTNGNNGFAASTVVSFMAEVPISGW